MQNAPTALAYGKAIEAGGLATVRGVALTADDRLRRDLIERLMCDLEVDVVGARRGARRRSGAADRRRSPARAASPPTASPIGTGARLRVSEKGRPFVRSVAALFDAYLSQSDDKPRHSRAV